MVNHMTVAGYFPEPYEGRLQYGDRDLSIVEIATMLELPPILKRYGDWAVTTEGIECLIVRYTVDKSRFDEGDWINHMREKTWVNLSDFSSALYTGRDFVTLGIIVLDASA